MLLATPPAKEGNAVLSRASLQQEVQRNHGNIPEELASRPQWVGWRYGEIMANGKRKKPLVNPRTGWNASPTDPATWGTLEEAKRIVASQGLEGLGFGLTEEDPYVLIDLDKCRNPKTGVISQRATRIIEAFDSYTEASPSGTGVHIYAMGVLPEAKKTKHVEMYDRERYFTFTGDVLEPAKPIRACQEALDALYARISTKGPQEAPKELRKPAPVALEDAALLEKARKSGNGAKFRRLHDEGDLSDHNGNHSSADFSLLRMLAFWTSRDPARMERMFDVSALGQRAKWKNRPDYRSRTIENAISETAHVYDPDWKRPNPLGPKASREVLEDLSRLHALALADPWKGRTGPGERWVFHALLATARDTGTMTEEGVTAPASSRHLATLCGKHRQRVEPLLKKIEEHGWIRLVSEGAGSHGSTYLLTGPPQPNCCQGNTQGGLYRDAFLLGNTSTAKKLCASLLGNTSADVLARVRNPPPQIEAEYDRNGRKIVQESRYLLRDLGDMGALLIEKVAARPGMDIGEFAAVLERDPSKVRRALRPIVEGGFIQEREGCYFPADRLEELVERHLEYSGSNESERKLREVYRKERAAYLEEYEEAVDDLREKSRAVRLKDVALACGVPEEEIERPADATQEEPKISDVAEFLGLARETFGVISPEHCEYPPYPPPLPGRDPLVHLDTEKARWWRANRERRAKRQEARA